MDGFLSGIEPNRLGFGRLHTLAFMPTATPTLQTGNPDTQTQSRQLQTTQGVGPSFVSQSGKASQLAYANSGMTFGGLVTRSIKPAPGYQRILRLLLQATGGADSGETVAIAADGPWSAIQSIQLRDPFGTVVYQTDGFGLYLVQLYSAQVGASGFQNPVNDPYYVAPTVGSGASGNFQFALELPFEFDPDTAYTSIPAMNSAAEMNIQIQFGSAAQVYSVQPDTLPTLTLNIEQKYWIVPLSDPSMAPPDDGSSHQWTQANGQNNISSGGNQRIELPDVGTYLSALICLMRDANNVRTDEPFSQDLELWIDGVPRFIENPKSRFAEMYRKFGITRPTGVVVYTWRDTIGHVINDDNMEQLLPTTPGTLLELFSGAWGTSSASTPPWNVTTYTGKLYPLGTVPER